MKLFELFNRIPFSTEIKKIEDLLRKTEFAPKDEIDAEGDVLDIELPTKKPGGGDAHFFQRVRERGITGNEITRALQIGNKKISPSDREWLSSEEGAEGDKVDFFDPVTKVFIPTMVQANTDCKSHPDDTSVCDIKSGGKAPKHKLVAKTIFKKINA